MRDFNGVIVFLSIIYPRTFSRVSYDRSVTQSNFG